MSTSTKKNIAVQDFSKIIAEGVIDIFSKFITENASESGKVKVSKLLDNLADVQNEVLSLVMETIPKEKKAKKEKKLKDPNAPKRPKSSYLFFCEDKRAEVKSENPDFKAVDVTKELGRMWKELEAGDKEPYEKKAQKAKKAYEKEMKDYVRPSDEELEALESTKKTRRGKRGSGESKKKKDPSAPKRPSSAFIYFCKDMREEAKAKVYEENPSAKATDVTKELGRMWKEDYNDEDSRKQWNKLAKKDKKRYEAEMEEYKPSEEDATPKTKRGKSKEKHDGEKEEKKKSKKTEALVPFKHVPEEDLFGEDGEDTSYRVEEIDE